jgi:hypothetical protein
VLRVNDALDFQDRDLRSYYRGQGFTEEQVGRIMDRLAGEIKPIERVAASRTNLQANESATDWPEFWAREKRLGDPPDAVLRMLKAAAPERVLANIRALEEQKLDAATILEQVVRDHPEIGGPDAP